MWSESTQRIHAWGPVCTPSHIHSFSVHLKEPREEVLVLCTVLGPPDRVVREDALKLMAGG